LGLSLEAVAAAITTAPAVADLASHGQVAIRKALERQSTVELGNQTIMQIKAPWIAAL